LGIVGILGDVHKAVRPDFREAGQAIVLLRACDPGDATDAELEFGSSEYSKEILGALWGYPPGLNLEKEAGLQRTLVEMAQAGLLESAHDCSEGGIAVTLAESCFGWSVGLKVDLVSQGLPPEFVLFGEDASRVVISCDRGSLPGIQQLAAKHGTLVEQIGETVSERMEIKVDGTVVVSATVGELRDKYENSLERALGTDEEVLAIRARS
jgi:phosphoribosylformylglycinamidine (FGAM) synthase-like enzyme